jgi:hypothetical protein
MKQWFLTLCRTKRAFCENLSNTHHLLETFISITIMLSFPL